MAEKSKRIVIFGAGNVGRMVLQDYKDQVAYFIDNNTKLHGQKIKGVPIKSVDEFVPDKDKYLLIIASYNQQMMEEQILKLGITNYKLFLEEIHGYYVTDELVFNPYEDNPQRDVSEQEYIENGEKSFLIEAVNKKVESLLDKKLMFTSVEIETINRCNGVCDFCPVSVKNDTREHKLMSDALFESIIDQLADMNYAGKLALFCNNEPFLDEKIIDRHCYARKKVPKARMHLFTNGTLLTIEKFKEIVQYLDELIIDNYQQDLKLIKPCAAIAEYCENYPELKKKVTIVLRKPHEILSNRGGYAPNRKETATYPKDSCVLPFKNLIIRPDGKISLCCSDPLGKNTLGDLTKESLVEAWYGDRFQEVRRAIAKGRENWKYCSNCDYFGLG